MANGRVLCAWALGVVSLWSSAPLAAQLTFVDRAPSAGVWHASYGRGNAMVDLDGDGLLDLANANYLMPNRIYRQLPDRTFEDVTAAWGFTSEDHAHFGVLAADFDNDGDNDLYFVPSGGTVAESSGLWRNDLATAGVFVDVSVSAGMTPVPRYTFSGTTLDYDRDGLLDIFLCHTNAEGCSLWRNTGQMAFENVTAAAWLPESGGSFRHCSAGDFDNDGWSDIAIGNDTGRIRLYRNRGDGRFVDVAVAVGLDRTWRTFGAVLEDLNNDGWLDVFLPRYHPSGTRESEFYLSVDQGTRFVNVTPGSGLLTDETMGHNTGDLDMDGYPDIFIGTGAPATPSLDLLFLVTPDGVGGLTATDVSASSGIQSRGETRCHGSAFGDYDDDGDIDIYANNGGIPTWPMEDNCLWQSQIDDNNWVGVDLTGVLSNRTAVGARTTFITDGGRSIYRHLTVGKGYATTDSPTQHAALGLADTVARLEIRWPSGVVQTLLQPPVRTRTAVLETGMRHRPPALVGGAIALELGGPPDDRALVMLALATLPVPVAVPTLQGEFGLAGPVYLVTFASLDGSGRGSFALPIPNWPELLGVTFYFQSWIHAAGPTPGGTLSNVVAVTIALPEEG